MIKSIILLFFCLLLTSCDPIRNLNFINKTDSDVKIKINLNPEAKSYTSSVIKDKSNGDSIVFNLKQKNTVKISFGAGVWSDPIIDDFSNSVNTIEFDTKNIKTIYKTPESVKKLLKDNKHGFLHKHRVDIDIN
ncbi:hypothetical protein [Flavobacterium sp. 140616W15]|uniref:hypothetical protein n=1 Tax=Flavobacterium sp. 140616W15 TaxID=2478552 RepID=UPI000F0C1D6B|nr:hypothetical protein [Flavobacterium sp. 140616W15]AYN02750.1 hypothetical protein EAG11_00095 [Flavobacterium sp. 140616W15]AYN06490.1 hypothetical protein EAG11_21825 [Flavobacterium sp. 140616W15]